MIPVGWIVVAVFIGIYAFAAKHKNMRLLVGSTLVLAVLMFFLSSGRRVNQEGQNVVVENNFGGRARFEKTGEPRSQVFLMVGNLERPFGMSGYSMKIPVLPVGTVDELNKKFGDFRKCDSPARMGLANQIVELRLVGAEPGRIAEIEKAFEKSIGNSEDVFLQLSAVDLKLVENSMQGRGGDLSPASIQENVLVEAINVFTKKVSSSR